MKTEKITQMQVSRLNQRELLNVEDACRLTQFRLAISRATFYRRYRGLIPFQSLSVEKGQSMVKRIRTQALNKLIDFWIENPRFVERLSTQSNNSYMKQYNAKVAEIIEYISAEE